ncbi:hypothetical protein HYH03_005091 [Edaphochlamys debaryana]|uniref:LysM domain-containing protein n=1 Tax=Edaphochlamys debaryana TaxID=47281 RepID=A0A835Y8E7_9CHLO|nr:hypothetical protein HYH03_005091 [Edaphochlamys debaryana]|eukprot:KAG2496673.1 hypothetical protein HYH03_005091 [Edaphochlamys debaryana]
MHGLGADGKGARRELIGTPVAPWKLCGGCGVNASSGCMDDEWPNTTCTGQAGCRRFTASTWLCVPYPASNSTNITAPGQCGGTQGACGWSSHAGSGPCVDAPWVVPACVPGSGCQRVNGSYWRCVNGSVNGNKPMWGQCGGQGASCGKPGFGPCYDGAWSPPNSCAPGLACRRNSELWWYCAPLLPGRPGGAAGQCGGRGGFCGVGGVGPCEDAAWDPRYYPCRPGQLCVRSNEQWWQCADCPRRVTINPGDTCWGLWANATGGRAWSDKTFYALNPTANCTALKPPQSICVAPPPLALEEPGTADQWEQCGGVGGKCGYCQAPMGDGGDPSPCQDKPWPSWPCKRGLTCVRDTPHWWHCAPVGIILSGTVGGPISEFQQCGGTGGRCNTTGYGPCVDASWAAPLTCRAGLACKRADRRWWQCEPAPPPGGVPCRRTYNSTKFDTCRSVASYFGLSQNTFAVLNPAVNCSKPLGVIRLCVAPLTDSVSGACTFDLGQRYWGGGYKTGSVDDVTPTNTTLPTASDCARLCEQSPACITWVWNKVSKNCSLLAALYSGSEPNSNYTSGSCSFKLSGGGSTGCSMEPGLDFRALDPEGGPGVPKRTAALCAAACTRDPFCITYVYQKSTALCWLQPNKYIGADPDPDTVSGVCPRKNDILRDRLNGGSCITSGGPCKFSRNGRFSLCVQANGDVELRDGTVPYWRQRVADVPGVNNAPPYSLCLLINANLVARNNLSQTYFQSNTAQSFGEGLPGPFAAFIVDNGNIVINWGTTRNFTMWSTNTEAIQLNLTGYDYYPKQDFIMIPRVQTLDRWVTGNSSFADFLEESHPFPSVMKDLCDADPLCTAFNTDGVFKRGPIWGENVQPNPAFKNLKQGIYAKQMGPSLIFAKTVPRTPNSSVACGPNCTLDTGRSDDLSKQLLIKRSGASNILYTMIRNPHINWWMDPNYVIPDLSGKPLCACPGPGAEAARFNKTRAADFPCLAGLSTEYAQAVCFCMQQLTDNAKYVWPFRTPGAAYDCSSFIECRGNRPVVVNGKVRRSCDSRTDPNEPEACPGCTAFDTVTGQEGFPGRICRRASLLPGVKDTVQCTEREPGSLCHWWLLPPGVYQDPYDESGMLVMRCPVDTYDAMWSPAPPGLEYCAAPDEGGNGYVFSTAMQTCIPRPPGWDAWRDACPARKVTIVSEDSLSVLSACESAFMGAPEKWTNASRGSVVGHRHRSRELLQVVSTDASLWRNPQTTNCPDPESCCPKLLNQAARNFCLTVPRTVGGIGYAAAETCVLNKECGSFDIKRGTLSYCRCLFAGFVSLGLRPGNCPRARHVNCRVIFG